MRAQLIITELFFCISQFTCLTRKPDTFPAPDIRPVQQSYTCKRRRVSLTVGVRMFPEILQSYDRLDLLKVNNFSSESVHRKQNETLPLLREASVTRHVPVRATSPGGATTICGEKQQPQQQHHKKTVFM